MSTERKPSAERTDATEPQEVRSPESAAERELGLSDIPRARGGTDADADVVGGKSIGTVKWTNVTLKDGTA